MSAANLRRFIVKAFDYGEWAVVVEAANREDAIRKAQAIYLADGFGSTMDAFEFCRMGWNAIGWNAQPLVQEVCQ